MMRKSIVALTVAVAGVFVLGELPAQGQTRSLRSGKQGALSLRLATSTQTAGFEQQTLRDGGTVYIAPRGGLSGGDIQAISLNEDNGDVVLSLTSSAAQRLATMMRKQGIDQLAVFTSGKFLNAAALELDTAGNRAILSGLSEAQAGRLARLVGATPRVTLVASTTSIASGETTSVDVFVSNVLDLRAFQISLISRGGAGATGSLDRDHAEINGQQTDYVFRGKQDIPAVDQTGGRIAAALFEGGVDVKSPAYLGRYYFTASADASGTFEILVKPNPSDSILMDSMNRLIPFSVDRSVAVITVGGLGQKPIDGE